MKLMKGNEAIAEGAVLAGCQSYFGYPITPQSEIPEYLSWRMPEAGALFLQAESEVAAINMVFGAGAAGQRTMTSTSSPGFSLMQEGISYMAGCEIPCVLVNIMRGGPGVGSILPAQCDYLQGTKGGGNGDYRLLAYAPWSAQEMLEHTMLAFDKADEYRTPVLILGDGLIGQMMEPVDLDNVKARSAKEKPWALGPRQDRDINKIYCGRMDAQSAEDLNKHLQEKFKRIHDNEVLYEEYRADDAEYIIAAFGAAARICASAVDEAREKGIKVGMIRPITVWPFPYDAFKARVPSTKAFFTVELNEGQMVEDIQLAVGYDRPVYFYGRNGGVIPDPLEVLERLEKIIAGEVAPVEDRI